MGMKKGKMKRERKVPEKGIRKFIYQLKQQMKEKHNGTWKLYMFLRGLVILFAVSAVLERRYEYFAICMLVLILFLVPSFLERKLEMELPSTLEKIILMFVFAAEIMGELQAFYIRIPWWDTMLHTMNGFLCAAVGFALVDVLNTNPKVKFQLSPLYCAVVAFCFSMTVGVLWEFFEFGMDSLFHLDMQKDTIVHVISSVKLDPKLGNVPYMISGITSETVNGTDLGLGGYLDIGLIDTMKDLIVNFIGAVVFSIIGYKYVQSHGKDELASRFIPTRTDVEETEEEPRE